MYGEIREEEESEDEGEETTVDASLHANVFILQQLIRQYHTDF